MSKCLHGKRKSRCKDCGGGSICEHGKRKSSCKECGGSDFCQHDKRKTECNDCGGSQNCQHGRRKSRCKDCCGSGICEHDRRKTRCKDCGGSELCLHGRQKSRCKECGGSQFCQHGREKSTCKDCGGSGICEHDRRKSRCKDCGGGSICEHGKRKSNCKKCGGQNLCKGAEDTCETYANPKYRGFCAHCFQQTFPLDPLSFQIRCKTKEIAVRDYINSNFEGFSHDKPLYLGGCDCSMKRRIDHRKLIGNTLLCIETDENQHKSYDKKDEEIRYDDLMMIHGGKFIFIRFNPDKFIKDGKRVNPMISTRLSILKQEIEKQITRIHEEDNDLVEIIHLFYDNTILHFLV